MQISNGLKCKEAAHLLCGVLDGKHEIDFEELRIDRISNDAQVINASSTRENRGDHVTDQRSVGKLDNVVHE
jgi:hypothetical protein